MLPEAHPCQECQAGIVHLHHVTYFTWLKDELITVPNFPAWVCDLCGKRDYDQRAIAWLSMLLNPNTGQRANPKANTAKTPQKNDIFSTTRPK